MKKIKMMVAEDHKLVRELLFKEIPLYSDRVEMVGAAKNGIELLQLLKEHIPDIILLDIYMPEMDGWKVLKVLQTDYPNIKTIMLSSEFDTLTVKEAILKGARAYIDKLDGTMEEIVAAIDSVSEDGFYFNDLIAQEIIIKLRSGKDISSLEGESFSDREVEIMRMICDGMQVKEIAHSMNISAGTVKYHKANVFRKTESKTNMDLLKYAIRKGIFNNNIQQPKPRKKRD
ncbi:hypothetical protein CNR22_20370 [Sphingobacteriaceae bacterium]|nr:hypothetical protein CNR22_20370 [Sphingobacteriaceae bacterium]